MSFALCKSIKKTNCFEHDVSFENCHYFFFFMTVKFDGAKNTLLLNKPSDYNDLSLAAKTLCILTFLDVNQYFLFLW